MTDEVKVGDGPWTSDAGQANFRDSQFLLDGGILLNKPVRPALEAIYRQTGASQVRRLLAYVVPHPGEPNRAADGDAAADRDPPEARDVLLGILTRLRSTDSVSRELSEIRQRNADAHQRRRVRDRLAAAMTDAADPLSNGAWSAYIEVRIANAARRIGQLLAAGQQQAAGRWSERELVEAVQRQLTQWRADPAAGRFFIPQGELAAALERTGRAWDWGATTVERLGDMAVDVLKRAVWLAPMGSAWQQTIVQTRTDLSATLKRIRDDRRALDDYWSIAPAGSEDAGPIPARRGDALGAATNLAQLQAWLAVVLGGWDRISDPDGDPGGRRAGLHGRALEVATHLQGCADTIAAAAGASDQAQSAIDPEGVERRRLKALYDYLLAPAKPTSMLAAMRRHRRRSAPPTPADVLARLLRLDVVQLAFSGASPEVEQEVELVQVSARQPETLTGVQLHHFGAFYRSSWRMNDWLHGRMDGAAHLVRMLLSTDRLRQRIWGMAGDPGAGA